ncbi:Reversion-inducing cysteine-rich protein [Halotydeus destructor]|nr:Reversion-inducing cysteine-rich protein [Halotydeus destructor]
MADSLARQNFGAWISGRSIPLAGLDIPLRLDGHCDTNVLRMVACAVHLKPCHTESNSHVICRSSCLDIVSKCLDTTRLTDQRIDYEHICSSLGAVDDVDCVVIPGHVTGDTHEEEGDYGHRVDRHETSSLVLFNPCHHKPCGQFELCVQSPECPFGKPCPGYKCLQGELDCQLTCQLGDMSNVRVPLGSWVRTASTVQMGESCDIACQCQHGGQLDKCWQLECLRNQSCYSDGRQIEHNTRLNVECKDCLCYNGKINCVEHKGPNGCSKVNSGLEQTGREQFCGCEHSFEPVCDTNSRTYLNACVAKCRGVEHWFSLEQCSKFEACRPNPCGHSTCIPRAQSCLSGSFCPQYICLDISEQGDCTLNSSNEHIEQRTVCDTLGFQHTSPCWLVRKSRTLAYFGQCLNHCSQLGPICGRDARTYETECSALANKVPVDYFGSCQLRPLARSSNESRCPAKCSKSIDQCPKQFVIQFEGNCCPFCGSALKLSLSEQLVANYDSMIKSTDTILNVQNLVQQFELFMSTSLCRIYGFQDLSGQVIVLLTPEKNLNLVNLNICQIEVKRFRSMVNSFSPQVTSLIPIGLVRWSEHLVRTSSIATNTSSHVQSLFLIAFLVTFYLSTVSL